MMENYSLSDIRAATDGGNGGFGNGGFLWVILLVILAFPMMMPMFMNMFGGNNFNGNNGWGGAATASAQHEILLGQQFDRVEQKLDSVGKGQCDATYALNNSIKDCCCQTQLGMKDIAAGIHAEGEATRAMIRENEIQNLRDKVNDLQVGLSQCRQNEYLVSTLRPCPVPSYLTCSPYQSYSPCGGGYQPNI